MTYTTTGIIGDLNGNQETISIFRPFILVDGTLTAVMRTNWTHDDLAPLNKSEMDYIRPIHHLAIEPGQVVLTVGPVMWKRLNDVGLQPKGEWHEDGGYMFKTGTEEEARTLCAVIYDTLTPKFVDSGYMDHSAYNILNNLFLLDAQRYRANLGHIYDYYSINNPECAELVSVIMEMENT